MVDFHRTNYIYVSIEAMIVLIELQIKLTSWAIVSMAGCSLGKVEEGERQGEKEKNRPRHT